MYHYYILWQRNGKLHTKVKERFAPVTQFTKKIQNNFAELLFSSCQEMLQVTLWIKKRKYSFPVGYLSLMRESYLLSWAFSLSYFFLGRGCRLKRYVRRRSFYKYSGDNGGPCSQYRHCFSLSKINSVNSSATEIFFKPFWGSIISGAGWKIENWSIQIAGQQNLADFLRSWVDPESFSPKA